MFFNRCRVTESLNCRCAESLILENHRQNVVTVTSITKYPNSSFDLSVKIVLSDYCFFFLFLFYILVTVNHDLFLSPRHYIFCSTSSWTVGAATGGQEEDWKFLLHLGKDRLKCSGVGEARPHTSYTLALLLSFILASFAAHCPL